MAMEKRFCISGPHRYDGGFYDQVEIFPIPRGSDNDSQLAGTTGAGGRSNRTRSGKRRCRNPKQQIPNGAIRQGVFGGAHHLIDNSSIRAITFDAIANPLTCVAHRGSLKDADKSAILQALVAAGLVDNVTTALFQAA